MKLSTPLNPVESAVLMSAVGIVAGAFGFSFWHLLFLESYADAVGKLTRQVIQAEEATGKLTTATQQLITIEQRWQTIEERLAAQDGRTAELIRQILWAQTDTPEKRLEVLQRVERLEAAR